MRNKTNECSVLRPGVLYNKSVQITAYADDTAAVIIPSNAAARDTYIGIYLKTSTKGLSIDVDKTETISQARSTRRRQKMIIEEDYRSS